MSSKLVIRNLRSVCMYRTRVGICDTHAARGREAYPRARENENLNVARAHMLALVRRGIHAKTKRRQLGMVFCL